MTQENKQSIDWDNNSQQNDNSTTINIIVGTVDDVQWAISKLTWIIAPAKTREIIFHRYDAYSDKIAEHLSEQDAEPTEEQLSEPGFQFISKKSTDNAVRYWKEHLYDSIWKLLVQRLYSDDDWEKLLLDQALEKIPLLDINSISMLTMHSILWSLNINKTPNDLEEAKQILNEFISYAQIDAITSKITKNIAHEYLVWLWLWYIASVSYDNKSRIAVIDSMELYRDDLIKSIESESRYLRFQQTGWMKLTSIWKLIWMSNFELTTWKRITNDMMETLI